MNDFDLGILLMIVGMTTVFAILLIVIGLGKALIALINKYAPEAAVVKPDRPAGSVAGGSDVPETVTAAIVSAVGVLTNGYGKVTKIEK